ncbi:MAG TPA: M28 family peptidase [Gemmatimonadales bacterium]|nr:M28 family peptidase [Gemmatimonadales bacterium]
MRRLLLVPLLALAACDEKPLPREFDGPSAFRYLEQQLAFGYRIPGTEPHRRMAAWLDSLARQRADSVILQRWTHVTAKGDSLELQNVIARFNPAAEKRILFLAHWDTRPVTDGKLSPDSTQKVMGANDGASGVALLLGVADVLKRAPPPPDLGVDLLFTDGEDYGDFETVTDVLIGARYYAEHQPPGPKPLYAVLFDLVADKDLQIYQEGNSVTGAPEVVSLVWERAREMGYGKTFVDTPRHVLLDDHVELQKGGIRAIDVVDFDYPYHHTPFDTIDKVSGESLQIVGDVAIGLVRREGGS